MDTMILFALMACILICITIGAVIGVVITHELQGFDEEGEGLDDEETGGIAGGDVVDQPDRGSR